jgi:hypothetical protein
MTVGHLERIAPIFFLEYAGELCIIALRRRIQTLVQKEKELFTNAPVTEKHTTKPEQNQAIYLATTSKCDNPLAA